MAWKECLVIGFAIWVSTTCTAGILLAGWQSLEGNLDSEYDGKGEFWQLCQDDHTESNGVWNCKARKEFYADSFTLAADSQFAVQIIWGFMLDARKPFCGPKMVIFLGLALFAAGNYLLASVNSEVDGLKAAQHKFRIGTFLMSIGGIAPLLSSLVVINYNTKRIVLLTAIINQGFAVNGLVYTFGFPLLKKFGVPVNSQRRTLNAAWTVLSLVNLLIVWLIWPTKPVKSGSKIDRLIDLALWRTDDDKETSSPCTTKRISLTEKFLDDRVKSTSVQVDEEDTSGALPSRTYILEDVEQQPLSERSILKSLLSWQFAFLALYAAFFPLAFNFYFENASSLLRPWEAWTRRLVTFQKAIIAIFFAWPYSFVISRFGLHSGLVVVSVSTSLMYLLLLLPAGTAITITTSTIESLLTCAIFTFFYTYIRKIFGLQNLGRMIGITLLVSAASGQLGTVLNSWAFRDGFMGPNLIFGVGSLLFLPFAFLPALRRVLFPPGLNLGSSLH